jgi:hypothetical protein
LPEVVAGETFLTSLTRSLWGRAAVLAVSGLLGLAAVLAIGMAVSNRRHATDPKPDDQIVQPAPVNPAPPDAPSKPPALAAQFNRRWLPEKTLLLIDLKLSRLAQQPSAMKSLAFLGAWWQSASQKLFQDLHLEPQQVRRLTWAATDPANCLSSGVVVLELAEDIDANRLWPADESIDLGTNFAARRPPRGASWPHPLLVVDAHTVVTGSEDALRKLVARGGDAELASRPMELLLKNLSPSGDLAAMVDLAPQRTEIWKPPANLLDVWPAGKDSWRKLRETPQALGISVQSADQQRCELRLVCDGETKAEAVRAEVEKLVHAAIQALPAHVDGLKTVPPPPQVARETPEQHQRRLNDFRVAIDRYGRVLNDLLAAMRAASCETTDGIVRVQFGWPAPGFLVSAATVIDSDVAQKTDWLAAARILDEGNHRGLLNGLLKYVKTQNPPRFPQAAASGVVAMRPETRVSWIAELLPYLGHPDWHLETANDWNDARNGPVVRQTLPEVVNPVFGPAKSASGYPVTHYVGLAGVGPDAARLPADDPRAGMFGYDRQTRQQDLDRGGAYTIAVLGVREQCGPWAQGGPATVRPLTQTPYVNGPDGFGSGQPDGMVAGMADGSVRFLSSSIDPEVVRQLASVHAPVKVDAAIFEPKPAAGADPKAVPGPIPPAVPNRQPPAPIAVKPPETPGPRLRAMLDVPIGNISLRNMPLAEAVQTVSGMGNVPVSFDPDAMQELGVTLRDPISADIPKTTVGKILDAIAAQRQMAVVVENGQIVLTSTTSYRQDLRTVNYRVDDLTGSHAQAAADLAALVLRLVAPESWRPGGGTVEISPDVLRIAQTGQVHYQILVFCEKLRVARGLPTKSQLSRSDPQRFLLATRCARAKEILGRPTSIDVNAPMSLASILDRFKQPAGTEIFIDRPALAAAEISESTPVKFRVDRLPQGEALGKLLDPLELAWRAVDAGALQVTTPKAVAARMELEFYPLGKLLAGKPPKAWIEQITALPGANWGEGGAGGAIYFDATSQCLIVLQSQPVQRDVEKLLTK